MRPCFVTANTDSIGVRITQNDDSSTVRLVAISITGYVVIRVLRIAFPPSTVSGRV
jgi:uncharacterized membrane protein YoaK (UPF0700 family)